MSFSFADLKTAIDENNLSEVAKIVKESPEVVKEMTPVLKDRNGNQRGGGVFSGA